MNTEAPAVAREPFAAAFVAAQREMPVLPKSATNPHFHSKFVPLDDVIEKALPVLNAHGFAVLQFPTTVDGQPALRTVLLHESGESLEDVMPLLPGKADPQGQGAALTYARRYALTAMLCLAADEDDDGNSASSGGASPQTTRADPPPSGPPAPPDTPSFQAPPPRPSPDDTGEPEQVRLTWGKHNGKTLGEAGMGYCKWLVENFEAKNAEQRRVLDAARFLVNPTVPLGSSGTSPIDDMSDIPF